MNSTRLVNKNYKHLYNCNKKGLRGAILEGGARSGKSYSAIHFILFLCSTSTEKITINIIRETYASFKTTLWDDFDKILTQLGIYSPFTNRDVQTFYLFGNKINFLGADKIGKFHGLGCDYFFMNEALVGISEEIFNQLEMRCRKFWFADYNPSASDHWLFDLEKRPDVSFCNSTLLDNPFVSKPEKGKILSCDPTNPINITNGTADDYTWKVYGLGLRATPEGLVFNNITYIDEIPKEVEQVSYGIDFGETNATAIVKTAIKLNPKGQKHDLYLQELFYLPTETSKDVIDVVKVLNIDSHIWCDNNQDNENAGIGWVSDMRKSGIKALLTRKFSGSRAYWIATIKSFNIHIVKDKTGNFKKEQENFKYRVVDGIQLSETVKKYDHLWSATGYSVVGDFRQYLNE